MNSNRAPLTALQIQQLARQPKNQNNIVSSKKYYSQDNKYCQQDNQNTILHKIVLELLANLTEPFPEFLYGLHIEYKRLRLHICPSDFLLKALEPSIKEVSQIYSLFYSDKKIKVYINIEEIDLIINLLNIIVNSKLDLNRNREVFRKQSVQELVNLKKLTIEDPKIKQVISMVQYIHNSTQIKLSGHTLVKLEKVPPIEKNKYFQVIISNIHQIATLTFLKYCVAQCIDIPEILLFLKLKSDDLIIDDYDFITRIPDSPLFTPLRQLLKYDNFQKITKLEALIEYEYYLVTTLEINYPMPTITSTILQLLNQLDSNCSRVQKVINDSRFEILLINLSQSQHPLIQNAVTSLLKLERKPNKIPKLKLKITKS